MIPLKLVLLPFFLTFLSGYSHGSSDETLSSLEEPTNTPPKSPLRRQTPLSPYAGAALQNARCFTERWQQKFEEVRGFYGQRKTLKRILHEAHQELLHITESPLFQEGSSPSLLNCHEAIRQAIQRRRFPSVDSDKEDDVVSLFIPPLRLSLRETNRHHLTAWAASLFPQLMKVFYEESLKRLTRESWLRAELLDSVSDEAE